MNCVFCDRIKNGEFTHESEFSVMFEPLNPVTLGHRLVVPKGHVKDALEKPFVTALVMEDAATWAKAMAPACNIITSVGREATQSIFHMHIHIVPRWGGDGLSLPWTGQK